MIDRIIYIAVGVLLGNLVYEIVRHVWRIYNGKKLVKVFEASMAQALEGKSGQNREKKIHKTKAKKK